MEVYTDTNHKKWYAMAAYYGVVFCDYKTMGGEIFISWKQVREFIKKIKQKWGGNSVA